MWQKFKLHYSEIKISGHLTVREITEVHTAEENCFMRESYKTHKYTLLMKCTIFYIKSGGIYSKYCALEGELALLLKIIQSPTQIKVILHCS
jgi:hypothetical protein